MRPARPRRDGTGVARPGRYEIPIYWSDEDQAYIAEVPELPGCAVERHRRAVVDPGRRGVRAARA